MPTIMELIKQYGDLMYEAGLYEREYEGNKDELEKAKLILDSLTFLVDEPCPKCALCTAAANNYCYDCGRKLK